VSDTTCTESPGARLCLNSIPITLRVSPAGIEILLTILIVVVPSEIVTVTETLLAVTFAKESPCTVCVLPAGTVALTVVAVVPIPAVKTRPKAIVKSPYPRAIAIAAAVDAAEAAEAAAFVSDVAAAAAEAAAFVSDVAAAVAEAAAEAAEAAAEAAEAAAEAEKFGVPDKS